MKKFIFSSIVVFFILSASSCTKDYTCVCKDTVTGAVLSTSVVSTSAGGGDSASENAQEECDDKESVFASDRCEIQL